MENNHSDPHMALYYMTMRALRHGTFVRSTESTETMVTEQLSDGTTIQLTLDPDSMTWTLIRFYREGGSRITLYKQDGDYIA